MATNEAEKQALSSHEVDTVIACKPGRREKVNIVGVANFQ